MPIKSPQTPQPQGPVRPPANPAAQRQKFGAPGGVAHPPASQPPLGFAPPQAAAPAPAPSQMGVDIFDTPAEDFNPAAEAAETFAPAPPDDGDHFCELALSERRDGAYREFTWGKDEVHGGVSLSLTATIIGQQDAFQGRRMYIDVNSFSKRVVGAEGSTNDIALVLHALGETPTGRPKTDAYRVQELVKGGYNKVIIESQWQAQFPYDKKKADEAKAKGQKDPSRRPYKVGQENFPRGDDGIPQPLHETPTGEPLRTVAVAVGFKRLTS